MNVALLRSIMVLHGDSVHDLAIALECTDQTVYNKLNEEKGSEFTHGDMVKIKNRYKLTMEQVDAIFF